MRNLRKATLSSLGSLLLATAGSLSFGCNEDENEYVPEQTGETIEDGSESMRGAYDHSRDAIDDAAGDTEDAAGNAMNETEDTTEDVADETEDAVEDTSEETEAALDDRDDEATGGA